HSSITLEQQVQSHEVQHIQQVQHMHQHPQLLARDIGSDSIAPKEGKSGFLSNHVAVQPFIGSQLDEAKFAHKPMNSSLGPLQVMPENARTHLLLDYDSNDTRWSGELDLGQPLPPSVNKEWHDDITEHRRIHLIGKVVTSIFPSPHPRAFRDYRIKDLIEYARKVEKLMYENADDQEEYYHLLAEKIHKVKEELRKKLEARRNALKVANEGTPACHTEVELSPVGKSAILGE
ncbi:hypothetical protein PFISCL1PPCAC_9574, partial [Pristionchus fissidentatus]